MLTPLYSAILVLYIFSHIIAIFRKSLVSLVSKYSLLYIFLFAQRSRIIDILDENQATLLTINAGYIP